MLHKFPFHYRLQIVAGHSLASGQSGEYYLRTAAKDRSNFDWHQYRLNYALVGANVVNPVPTSLEVTKYATPREPDGVTYVTGWPAGDGYCIYTTSWFKVDGIVKDQVGNPMAGADVTIEFKDLAWGPSSPFYSVIKSANTNADGTFEVNFSELPPPQGKYSFYNPNSGLTHYYDIGEIDITCGAIIYTEGVYIESYVIY